VQLPTPCPNSHISWVPWNVHIDRMLYPGRTNTGGVEKWSSPPPWACIECSRSERVSAPKWQCSGISFSCPKLGRQHLQNVRFQLRSFSSFLPRACFQTPGCSVRINFRCLSLTAHAVQVHSSAKTASQQLRNADLSLHCLGCLRENGFGACPSGPKTCPKVCPREVQKFVIVGHKFFQKF
jgi:hypothetical protein